MANQVKFLQGSLSKLVGENKITTAVDTMYIANDGSVMVAGNQTYYGAPTLTYEDDKIKLYGVSGNANTLLGSVDLTLHKIVEGATYVAKDTKKVTINGVEITFTADEQKQLPGLVMLFHDEHSSGDTHSVAIIPTSDFLSVAESEINTIETAVGLNTDGTYSASANGHYISGATSVKDAIEKLDTAIFNASPASTGKTINVTATDDGANIEVNIASAKTASATAKKASNKNFIEDTGDGIAVKNVDTDASILSDDITVVGTAFANSYKDFLPTTSEDGQLVIKAGTSVQDILVKLLSKELWSATPSVKRTFSASVTAPTPTFDKSGTVEVGTVAKMSALTPGASSASQSLYIETMQYGYKLGENGTYTSATKWNNQTLTPTATSSTNSLKLTIAGFSGAAGATSSTTIASRDLVVSEGSNSASCAQTGYTYAADTTHIDNVSIYVATNLKNYTKSATDGSNNIVSNSTWGGDASKTASCGAKTSATITGKYKYYYGVTNAETVDDVTTGGLTTGWTNVDSATTIKDASKYTLPSGGYFVIMCASKYKLNTIEDFTFGVDYKVNFTVTGVKELAIGGTSKTNYNVYIWKKAPDSTPDVKNITLAKA